MLAPYTPLIALRAAALDMETTGLDLSAARAVQIAVLPLDGAQRNGDALEVLVNPQIPIPAQAQRIHGISDSDVSGKPVFAEIFGVLGAALNGRAVIGYNTEYDLTILEKECRLAGLAWSQPCALDVRFLAGAVSAQAAVSSLEKLAEWLGVTIDNRHTALGDAEAAAQIYIKLLPLLRERGIRTLGEAENAVRAVLERAAAAQASAVIGPAPLPAQTQNSSAAAQPDPIFLKLDSFPYRHRVKDLMRAPVFVDAAMELDEAAQFMIDKSISALLVRSGQGIGIVTERDLLWSLAKQMRGGARQRTGEVMSLPLQTVHEDDFLYRAIGRMDRLRIRHLAVCDDHDAITGVISARALLAQRASSAIALGDEIDRAPDIAALGLARAKLAAVAISLVQEDVGARAVAEVISAEVRSLNARAAALAEDWMRAQGRGGPPCAYALLVLGSAGRGESLLSADQDNALVLARGEPDGPEDRWFAEFAAKTAEILDTCGIPYCKGGVMARNPAWRHNMAGWRMTIDGWVTKVSPQDLLEVDIFFDARAVHGDLALGAEAIDYAWRRASASSLFIRLVSENARQIPSAFTLWGGLRTDEAGRAGLKRLGLMPIFTGARVLALKHGVRARSTPARLKALIGKEGLPEDDINAVLTAHGTLFEMILQQQILDKGSGIAPSSRVDISRLTGAEKRGLKQALSDARLVGDLLGEGLVA